MPQTVAVLGGGVAGLSAAHELAERGFTVQIYERQAVPGGKARSIPVPNSNAAGHVPLPGEHGFRFFPGFYKHIIDTMRRTPLGTQGGSAADNLTIATKILLARADQSEIIWLARTPTSLADLNAVLMELFMPLGVPADELAFFVTRLLIFATSCAQRRLAEFENIRWWDFIQAAQMSTTYQAYLGEGLTRSLVAMRAEESSTRTVGATLWQLLYGLIWLGKVFDRLLCGPTNDVWLRPWTDHLQSLGVHFNFNHRVVELKTDGKQITGITVENAAGRSLITADFYIAAMPVEVMAPLVTASLKTAAPSLANLDKLNTRWMNGIQFYLSQDLPLVNGHAIYLDSPWALTSVSQRQFWPNIDFAQFGHGNVQGILSVDISEWQAPGVLYGKPASMCTAEQIKEEVWTQLKQHLNVAGATPLQDANLVSWFLDPDITFPNPSTAANAEPLLINTAGSLQYRPEAQVELTNLFIASDYVKTYTDIACMEAANEAARRAVNCLLVASGSQAEPAQLWPLVEPDLLKPIQEIDRIRFSLGLAHHVATD